ncbi:hypothetical protein ACFV6F_28685 [Kitasatospora phosalacinea]|uniref:hypothetical protein n=1 Tax=Kitasatospora phosalacinea TaxID=2065 RepID=UPI0036517FE8
MLSSSCRIFCRASGRHVETSWTGRLSRRRTKNNSRRTNDSSSKPSGVARSSSSGWISAVRPPAVPSGRACGWTPFSQRCCGAPRTTGTCPRRRASIDPHLYAEVAAGLGLPAPAPDGALADPDPSPALSQLGRDWPVAGRTVGLVTDPDGDLAALASLRRAILDADLVPLLIAPTGGQLTGEGTDPVTVQRTFAAARSVEFDAIVLLDTPAPAADATPGRDAKAGAGGATGPVDPRIVLMLGEAWRHAKAIGALPAARRVLDAAGIAPDAPGVVVADDTATLLDGLTGLLAAHRAWDRFPPPPEAAR